MIAQLEFVKVSGRGCSHCEKRVVALEDECAERKESFRYCCPFCRAVWFFSERLATERQVPPLVSEAKCTRCGKMFSLWAVFWSWGEQDADGVLVNGAAYCWNCVEKVAEIIEEAAQSSAR